MPKRPPIFQPVDPGLLKQCPKCGRYFGLVYKETERDAQYGRVYIYECKKCGERTEFLRWFPTTL